MTHCSILKGTASWSHRKLPSKQSITVRFMIKKDYPGRKTECCIGGVSSLEAKSLVRRCLKHSKVIYLEVGSENSKKQ